MTVEQMRDAIYNVYSTDSWHRKVKYASDTQIIALYYKFKDNGQLKVSNSLAYSSLIDRLKNSDAAREAGYEDGDELIIPEGGIGSGPIIIRKRKAACV